MSTFRKIKGYNDYLISKSGTIISLKKGKPRIITPQVDKRKGYLSIKLSKDGKSKRFKIHRLVAINFIPNPEHKPQVNHIDGNKQNNNYKNLEWVTNQENQRHASANGLKAQKLTKEDVLEIRKDNRSLSQIAKDYNIAFQTVSEIKNNKIWKYV